MRILSSGNCSMEETLTYQMNAVKYSLFSNRASPDDKPIMVLKVFKSLWLLCRPVISNVLHVSFLAHSCLPGSQNQSEFPHAAPPCICWIFQELQLSPLWHCHIVLSVVGRCKVTDCRSVCHLVYEMKLLGWKFCPLLNEQLTNTNKHHIEHTGALTLCSLSTGFKDEEMLLFVFHQNYAYLWLVLHRDHHRITIRSWHPQMV